MIKYQGTSTSYPHRKLTFKLSLGTFIITGSNRYVTAVMKKMHLKIHMNSKS